MYKLTFKDQPKQPYKIVEHYGNTTKVTLTGFLNIKEYDNIPFAVKYEDTIFAGKIVERGIHGIFITTTAKTKCAEGDKYDEVLGERIAESKAKMKLYKAMLVLLKKTWNYYFKIMLGKGTIEVHMDGGIYKALLKYEKLVDTELDHLEKLMGR